jgi:hypothetical protein
MSNGEKKAGGGNAPDEKAAKKTPCKSPCKGYFYTVLNAEDIQIIDKPTGMDSDDAREAITNALQRKFEPDEGAKCPEGCICQPLKVETSGYNAPKFTTPWKEEVTAHIRFAKTPGGAARPRTVKAKVSLVKYQGEGLCRADKHDDGAEDGTFNGGDD